MDFRLILPLELNDDDGEDMNLGNLDDHGVPLPNFDPIPSPVVRRFPKLKLSEYDLKKVDVCSNIIAMPHNAVRLEISEMWSDILSSLRSREDDSFTEQDGPDLQEWWSGFARFALTTSMVDEMVVEAASGDVILDFDKDAREIARLMRRFKDMNRVSPELACRAMGESVEKFMSKPCVKNVKRVVDSWRYVSTTLTGIYEMVEDMLGRITIWRRGDEAVHKGLEERVAGVYLDRGRWGNDDAKCGEMIIVLTRWMGDEDKMRCWLERTLKGSNKRSIERWLNAYCDTRLKLVGNFHNSYVPTPKRGGTF